MGVIDYKDGQADPCHAKDPHELALMVRVRYSEGIRYCSTCAKETQERICSDCKHKTRMKRRNGSGRYVRILPQDRLVVPDK